MTIPSLSADLVGSTEEPPAMAFAALSHIFENQLQPDMKTVPPEVMSKLKSLTSSTDLDVKALSLASIHLIKGSDEKTRRFLEDQISKLGPDEKKVRDRWALSLAFFGDLSTPDSGSYRGGRKFGHSVAAYRKSLELKPDDDVTLQMLALAFQQNGDNRKAIQTFNLALKEDPKSWTLWVNYGNLLWDQEKRGEAAEAYEKSIDINPHYSLGQFNMGNVYYGKGDYKKARYHYEQAVELDPSIALAHFYLARAYLKLQLGEKALASVEKAVGLDPSHESARMMRQDLRQIFGR